MVTFFRRIQSVELRRDIYGRVHTCSLHTHGSMFGRAANPEFRSLLVPHALTNRAVCQPLQVAPSNKWSWVRADNTGHVDLVNLARGILQEPLRNTRVPRHERRRLSVREESSSTDSVNAHSPFGKIRG